jgi:hypothetical protein
MGHITPSKFAGHSMLCPYEANSKPKADPSLNPQKARLGSG